MITPIRGTPSVTLTPPRPRGSGSPRSPGSTAAARAISSTCARAEASSSASTSSSMCLPTRTPETFVHPRAGSAASTALPWGSEQPRLQGHEDLEAELHRVLPQAIQVDRAGLPVRLPRAPMRCRYQSNGSPVTRSYASRYLQRGALRSPRRGARAAAARGPSRSRRASRGRTACRTTAAGRPARTASAGQNRDESGVQHLVDQDQLAVAEPELELRVGHDHAALQRDRGDPLVDRERELLQPLGEPPPDQVGGLVERERQVVALGRPSSSGVKIGLGQPVRLDEPGGQRRRRRPTLRSGTASSRTPLR